MIELKQLHEASGGNNSPLDEAPAADHAAIPSKIMELAVGIIALGLSLLALYLSRNIHVRMGGGGIDAKWWPTTLSITACILSACILGQAIFKRQMEDRSDLLSSTLDGWKRVVASLTLMGLYIFGWSQLGYIVPTAIFLVALLWLYGVRRWKPLLFYPVLTTAFIYGLFHLLLRVPL